MSFYERHAPNHRNHDRELPDRTGFRGYKAQDSEAELPTTEWEAAVKRGHEFGLMPAGASTAQPADRYRPWARVGLGIPSAPHKRAPAPQPGRVALAFARKFSPPPLRP